MIVKLFIPKGHITSLLRLPPMEHSLKRKFIIMLFPKFVPSMTGFPINEAQSRIFKRLIHKV